MDDPLMCVKSFVQQNWPEVKNPVYKIYTLKTWFDMVYAHYKIERDAIQFFDIWKACDSIHETILKIYKDPKSQKCYILENISTLYPEWKDNEVYYFIDHPDRSAWTICTLDIID